MPLFGRPLHFLYRGTSVETYFHNKLVVLLFYFFCLEDCDNILQLRLSCSLRDTKKKSKFCTFTFLYLLSNFLISKRVEKRLSLVSTPLNCIHLQESFCSSIRLIRYQAEKIMIFLNQSKKCSVTRNVKLINFDFSNKSKLGHIVVT